MDKESNDIFHIQLNREGLSWILRFCRLVKLIFFLSILIAIPSLLTGILHAFRTNMSLFKELPLYRSYYIMYPYLWMLYILVWVVQIYFYWKFSITLRKAVSIPDEKGFNESFQQLYFNAYLIIIVSAVSLIGNVFTFLISLKYPV